MSRYSGLDKIDIAELKIIETYRGVKIYECIDENHEHVSSGILVVSRNYLVDCQLNDIASAHSVIDHFLQN